MTQTEAEAEAETETDGQAGRQRDRHGQTRPYSSEMAVGQNQYYHFEVGAPPILVYFSGWIGMFTGGAIWILAHGQIIPSISPQAVQASSLPPLALPPLGLLDLSSLLPNMAAAYTNLYPNGKRHVPFV